MIICGKHVVYMKFTEIYLHDRTITEKSATKEILWFYIPNFYQNCSSTKVFNNFWSFFGGVFSKMQKHKSCEASTSQVVIESADPSPVDKEDYSFLTTNEVSINWSQSLQAGGERVPMDWVQNFLTNLWIYAKTVKFVIKYLKNFRRSYAELIEMAKVKFFRGAFLRPCKL